MYLALKLNPFEDSDVLYAQQIGINHIIGDVPAWDTTTLTYAANRVHQAGLSLAALNCLPDALLIDAFSESPQREPALDTVCRIITDAGKLGIRSLGYRIPLPGPVDADTTTLGRADAVSQVYHFLGSSTSEAGVPRQERWQSLARFLHRILPVAEQAGVRLIYQTDIALLNLPVEQRFLESLVDLNMLFQIGASESHGLDLDHGFVTQVLARESGWDASKIIRHFGSKQRLFAVRMRGIHGSNERINDVFLDEDKAEIIRALQAYKATGYDGPLSAAPMPQMANDTTWGHKGFAFSTGYMKGLLQVLG